jgi:hypothetical protein
MWAGERTKRSRGPESQSGAGRLSGFDIWGFSADPIAAESFKRRVAGGGRGIRTLDTVARIHAFQACALNHSAIPPREGADYSGAAARHKGGLRVVVSQTLPGGSQWP